jgi:hypothetical protein
MVNCKLHRSVFAKIDQVNFNLLSIYFLHSVGAILLIPEANLMLNFNLLESHSEGFYVSQRVNRTPPLSSRDRYAILDVDPIEENSTLPSNSTDETTTA